MKKQNRWRLGVVGLFVLAAVISGVILAGLNREPEAAPADEPVTTPDATTEAEAPEVYTSQNGVTLTAAQAPAFASVNIVTPNPYGSANCTTGWGPLTLINPNFTVETAYISARSAELINIAETYGIRESGNNGDGWLDAEAASHLAEMVAAYAEAYPGHELTTRSCFRRVGTTCGRLCAATGTSDHHSGYTCDLIDPSYGTTLDTDAYADHPEWQWLRAHAHEYGFIDRFPEAWAGGSMSEPANIDATGTTGLFETWHYRYVGKDAATEIATGKYNQGNYDSLEHYLLSIGAVTDLLAPTSCTL